MELVLADPQIEEPAQIAFDGNGRMFVLELRGYMQDADGTGELAPVGRISVHTDADNDGAYETHGVFVDNMIFPRFVMPFGANAVLSKESNADELWKYTDTDGDSVADAKELFATGMGRLMNVEHQESGLLWAMDNWMYSTINLVRLKWTPTGVLREPTASNGGQWGVTQDNFGKVWFQAGASGMPGYFQLPVAYGNFSYSDQFEENLNITWGAPVLIADMQGGMGAVRMPDGSLARATGAAGNDVYRGDRLPADMVGDYFYGETVGRIVRRLRPVKTEGLTQLRNVYPLSEFIQSTDPLFRPVDVTTAPDGTMYITDMYRGIIQEYQWSGPGTYLRQKIDQYQLDKVVRHGRIWRLSFDGMGRDTTAPRMLDQPAAELVAHLSHPNGWWRDTAQQLLVLKQDRSVVPALTELARSSSASPRPAARVGAAAAFADASREGGNQLARIHALWTLEGLGVLDPEVVRGLMTDADPQVRLQAIRASETLYKAGDRSFGADYRRLTGDPDTDVVMQAMMTLNVLKVPDANATIRAVMDDRRAQGIQVVASTILEGRVRLGSGGGLEAVEGYSPEETASIERGGTAYAEVCFACHGGDGRGEPMPGAPDGQTRAPALAASPRVLGHQDYVIKLLLHGLTGPIDGTTYAEVMIPMGSNPDEWVASVGSYIRNAFGNRASVITPAEVARVRAATAGRTSMWEIGELLASLPRQLVVTPEWQVTASHNPAVARNALTIQPWTSGRGQEAGMWLQVELPVAVRLTEIQFESTEAQESAEPAVAGAPTRSVFGPQGGAAGPPPVGYPREYEVRVSMDGTTWSEPVAGGEGSGTDTRVVFDPVQAKFVRLIQTGSTAGAPPLSIRRLRLFEAGS
jgi:mono/diheme cytochrome c family protein/glucose/arabinose dehydrogenase